MPVTIQPADALSQLIADAVRNVVRQELRTLSKAKLVPRWLDLEQAAILMSTTKDGVRGMLRSGLFPARKMGARIMIDMRDIEKAFSENTLWLNTTAVPMRKAA